MQTHMQRSMKPWYLIYKQTQRHTSNHTKTSRLTKLYANTFSSQSLFLGNILPSFPIHLVCCWLADMQTTNRLTQKPMCSKRNLNVTSNIVDSLISISRHKQTSCSQIRSYKIEAFITYVIILTGYCRQVSTLIILIFKKIIPTIISGSQHRRTKTTMQRSLDQISAERLLNKGMAVEQTRHLSRENQESSVQLETSLENRQEKFPLKG